MAHGRPDFFGTSIHPKFGTSKMLWDFVTISPPAESNIVTLSGKGVLFGGYIFTNDVDANIADNIALFIDGRVIMRNTLSAINYWSLFPDTKQVLTMLRFDPDLPDYAIGFPLELPFESSFTFKYKVFGVNDVGISYRITYYTIE